MKYIISFALLLQCHAIMMSFVIFYNMLLNLGLQFFFVIILKLVVSWLKPTQEIVGGKTAAVSTNDFFPCVCFSCTIFTCGGF